MGKDIEMFRNKRQNMKEKIVGTLSAGMTSMKKGIQSGVDSCKLGG